MSEPQTPTGKQRDQPAWHSIYCITRTHPLPCTCGLTDDILAIEAEAIAIGAQEAEEDAARLALSLDDCHVFAHHMTKTECLPGYGCSYRDALRLHDERVKP